MQLPLVKSLAPRLQADCAGLESGNAPILEKVTPATADLLRWWYQRDCRNGHAVNFHDGQRQAILHAIYAHEVLQAETLVELYQKLAAEVLLTARRMEEVMQSRHPKYCLKMATGTGKTWVLQALLYWQLLNAARAPEDQRFTRNFLIVAPGLIVYQRLLDAFLGKERQGQRDFATSGLAQYQALEALNRRYERGGTLDYPRRTLAALRPIRRILRAWLFPSASLAVPRPGVSAAFQCPSF